MRSSLCVVAAIAMVIGGSVAAYQAGGQSSSLLPKATGAFSDGTSVETVSLLVTGSSTTAYLYQIKQADGTVCYGISGVSGSVISAPQISCIK
ncbi:MAG: hypothetical protein OM95_00845 [Bdellovibrio sp. ArHS]|uniref:hypothetical protein n=1 Tax=Bdellovibrio sp. ArHS TaxID=1569284 RepID=UPI000583FC0E|nr:hypothetical protein [Bdellovibrio sp. ArHS]KHD89951.1 MAG: hypothetical protein OM95_00845 [Bdellovibrio sp. ArHS]